jgi:uncharacterized protein YcbX
MASIDWSIWRHKYVSGPDTLTLKALAEQPGAPAYQSLKRRSQQESWADQRNRYRYQADTLVAAQPGIRETVAEVAKIVDKAEMLSRHSRASRLATEVVMHELQQLRERQEKGDPVSIRVSELANLLKASVDIERVTEGLSTAKVEVTDSRDPSIYGSLTYEDLEARLRDKLK